MQTPGHDPGHPPEGLTWGQLVHTWRDECGSWPALAEELARRAGSTVELPNDLGSIERGLRRLARRGHDPGGQYGRWLERFFGVPSSIESWVRWLGQYHSRFADLPVSLRRQQLSLWDRPPISDAAIGTWIDLGMASVGFRADDRAVVDARLSRASRSAPRAGVAAQLEHACLAARIHSEDKEHDRVAEQFERMARWLEDPQLSYEDAACYRARYVDARAYRLLHPLEGARKLEEGEALYRGIPSDTDLPFVNFRRALGLAYCAWKREERARGLALALEAAEHAGDGGLVRLRAMAFNLASRIAVGDEARALRARALRLSAQLEDEHLLIRVSR